MNLTPIIKESFQNYAGAVLQSRALVDVRDCLKPSARQIFYCLYTDKFLHSKPFKKTLKAIGSAMRMYIHGDSSCEGVIMRAGQPFAMRYPLIEVEGSYGNLMESGNWAASRYTSARLSALAEYLFKDIEKETIDEWRNNYDDTEQYPSILSSKGFFNIVNGTMGIGVGAASSIPAFNLKEVNEALIKLLWNPEIDFNDIYCAPDFATGAILLNENEVKESLKNGTGSACKLRSVIEYDSKEKCLIVTEIPYSVYTNTICGELEEILEAEDNPGIERFNDLTGPTPLIKIYLSKTANPNRVLKYLYKNTSLQYYYSINMTMLENGRYPKIFSWKEALQSHINHEKIIYKKGFEFDLKKIEARLHIIEGILICLAQIDEVVHTIKASSSTLEASLALQKNFILDELQAKAILDMKLSKLAHLEVEKLKKEEEGLKIEQEHIKLILNSEDLLKKEIEKGFKEVSSKFGDSRRTKIINLENNSEGYEERILILNLTNKNNLFVTESSTLFSQKRGGVGNKFKLAEGEYIISTISAKTNEVALFFSNKGNGYAYPIEELQPDQKNTLTIESILPIKSYEKILSMTSFNTNTQKDYIIFITKKGMLKKTKTSEFNTNRKGGLRAIDMDSDDEIISTIFLNDEKIGILTEKGYLLICQTKDINSVHRIAKGVKGIKLSDNDFVISAKIIPNDTKELLSISNDGLIKRTSIDEMNITGRYTKGSKLQKLKDRIEVNTDKELYTSSWMVDFLAIHDEKEVLVVSNYAQIKIKIDEISLLGKGAQGNKSIKMSGEESIISLSKF